MMTDPQRWIWACTKRLAELHPGEPMSLEDWERVATGLHENSDPGGQPENAAELYTLIRASKPDSDDTGPEVD